MMLPEHCEPRNDPAFRVPAVGRDYSTLDEASLLTPTVKKARTDPEEAIGGFEDGVRISTRPQEEIKVNLR